MIIYYSPNNKKKLINVHQENLIQNILFLTFKMCIMRILNLEKNILLFIHYFEIIS